VEEYKWWLAAGELGANIIVGGTFSEFSEKDWVAWTDLGNSSLEILKKLSSDLDDCFSTI
jgi:hypothetical protein